MDDSVDNNTAAETAIDALKLEENDDFVDPWSVQSQSDTGIDYDKLIRKHLMSIEFIASNYVDLSFDLFIFLV